MRVLGNCLRWFLSINTIWGLLILSAFVLCVAQHYLPTATVLPADHIQPGDNHLTIRVTGREKRAQDYAFTLVARHDALDIRAEDQQADIERPWLIDVRRIGAGLVLRWDCQQTGPYEVALGEAVVARGRLVNLQSLTDAAFEYATIGFDIALGLVAAMVLFLGLMKVGEDAGIVQIVARVFRPLLRFLFPEVPPDHPANGALLMNITTTVLGLGNAATPFGLKAMKELQSLNPHPNVATNAQVMLLGYNTAGFALLPTTLLAVRKSAGCSDPFEIIGTCMLAGAAATITAITMVKLLGRLPMFSVAAAVAEQEREKQAAPGGEGA